MNHSAKVGKRLRDFHILTVHSDWLNGRIQDVTERLDLTLMATGASEMEIK